MKTINALFIGILSAFMFSGVVYGFDETSNITKYAECIVANDLGRAEKLLAHNKDEKSFQKIVKKTKNCKVFKSLTRTWPPIMKGQIAMAIIRSDKPMQTYIENLTPVLVDVEFGLEIAKTPTEFEEMIFKYSKCLLETEPKMSLQFALADSDPESLARAIGEFDVAVVDCINNIELMKLPINITQQYVARAIVAKAGEK